MTCSSARSFRVSRSSDPFLFSAWLRLPISPLKVLPTWRQLQFGVGLASTLEGMWVVAGAPHRRPLMQAPLALHSLQVSPEASRLQTIARADFSGVCNLATIIKSLPYSLSESKATTWADINGDGPCSIVFIGIPLSCGGTANWIGDITGRVGLAHDNLLLYLKGGWAWSGNDYNISGTFNSISMSGSVSNTRSGGLIGLGIEYAFTQHWTAKMNITTSILVPTKLLFRPRSVSLAALLVLVRA
jgi:hypothetical protein